MTQDISTQIAHLSDGATLVLLELLDASEGNGHDFGLMEDAFLSLPITSQQFAAYVNALDSFIEWRYDCGEDAGVHYNGVQFGLTDAVIDAHELVIERARQINKATAFRDVGGKA